MPAWANTATPNAPESPNAESISSLYFGVLGVCLTIFVLVGGWLLYTAVRFRERRGDTHEPPQTHGSTRLEIGWTIVPALIVIGILVFTLIKIPSAEKISSNAMNVNVVAQQYSFTYTYPSGKTAPGGILVLPVGRAGEAVDHFQRRRPRLVGAVAGAEDRCTARPHQLCWVHAGRGGRTLKVHVPSSAGSGTPAC